MDKNKLEMDVRNYFLNEWLCMRHYRKSCIEDIWFSITKLKHLLKLLEELEIYIKWIEIFKWSNFQFHWDDFWYKGTDLVENYNLIRKFLERVEASDDVYLSIRIAGTSYQRILNEDIYWKYWDYI